jgi:hypothetical protein
MLMADLIPLHVGTMHLSVHGSSSPRVHNISQRIDVRCPKQERWDMEYPIPYEKFMRFYGKYKITVLLECPLKN